MERSAAPPPPPPSTRPARRRPAGRRRRGVAVVLAAITLAVLATAWTPPLVEPATSGRTFGQGPLEAVTAAATAKAACGLSSVELAAMMMAPTYTEAGGPVPPPMALSRYDNVNVNSTNANLFAFGQTGGSYVNAFWSPGVGMWQFDSAGGWSFGAAGAIDSVTSANQAATTIAYRWCNAPSDRQEASARRKYAWGPWYGCSTTDTCETIFASLVAGNRLNTAFDSSVTRYGGMQQRTCDLAGVGTALTCWYVNPALGQGSRGWTGGTYTGPSSVTPLPKPFYVIETGGREYRVWIREDTGYDTGITGSKPVTANARTSVQWSRAGDLCDTSAGRGECAGGASPIGVLDAVAPAGPEAVRVQGWSFDQDTTAPIPVHVYVDTQGTAVTADVARPDVGAAFPGMGANHGFDAVVPGGAGPRQVCAYGINVLKGGNTLLGCKPVTVTGNPIGNLDVVATRPGAVDVQGWITVPYAPDAQAVITVDGQEAARFDTTVGRPDVDRAVPGAGATAGFAGSISLNGGTHRVCLSGGGARSDYNGCRTVNLPTGSPVGVIDVVSTGPGTVSIAGWALDPDTASPIAVHVYVNQAGTALSANGQRTDVAGAFPGYGSSHGYSATLGAPGGPVSVCAWAINVGGGSNTLLGCRDVTVAGGDPIGSFDVVQRTPGGIRVLGWAIDPDTTAPIPVHVYVGSAGAGFTADVSRPDVAAAFKGYGDRHGFDALVGDPGGNPTVCAWAINAAGGGGNRLLGCKTL